MHVNVLDHNYKGVDSGWKQYYWKPWRKFLAARRGWACPDRRRAHNRPYVILTSRSPGKTHDPSGI